MKQKELLKISHLYKTFLLPKASFWQGKRPVLYANDDINLSIFEGETFGLVGESGSGKSVASKYLLSKKIIKKLQNYVLVYYLCDVFKKDNCFGFKN